MDRVLKKFTTIPEYLYVNRDADKQLKQIVNEMQRPGYVLVARQMGKTNLLFNAKRVLENESRLFVYVDLSNVFKYELDCYRNIIDSIIEPNEELFHSIESIILELRTKKLPAHKEYSRSLRVILDFFGGDIVIVLDEIDALRSAEYSDNIFAQIRSNYFSRTNFPVFEKLTYILSGVIEPSELIKDRNKSPFNIGDKIYLDDFTYEEHKSFVKKSQLSITDEISKQIYKWTNGNPRLTFDICSEVETILIKGDNIDLNSIELLIEQKYLISYDIAPIDHIRELVKSNKKVRDAVLKIHYKKYNELSDEIKKKLYLYGIIGSEFHKECRIKNLIISKSISEEWIKSIDKETQGDLNYGLDKISQGHYDEAISILIEFLENSSPSRDKLEICNYNLGYAFYVKKKYQKAIDSFSNEFSISSYKNGAKSFIGICQIGLGEIELGVEILKDVIKLKTDDFAYRNALLNYAKVIVSEDMEMALDLYDRLLKSTNEYIDDVKEEELNKIRALTYYYKSEIYSSKGENEKAIELLKEALKYSDLSDSLFIRFTIYDISIDKDKKDLSKIVSLIVDNAIKFNSGEEYPFSFAENHLFYYLDLVFDEKNLNDYNLLLNYTESKLYNNEFSKANLILWLSNISEQKEIVIKNFLETNSDISKKDLLSIYSRLSIINYDSENQFFEYFKIYKSLFVDQISLGSDDIYLFTLAVRYLSDKSKIIEALKLCELIDEKFSSIQDEELKFEFVIIYYWFASLYFSLKNRKSAIVYANKSMNMIDNSKNKKTSMIDEKGLKYIYGQLKQIKDSSKTHQPIIKHTKYGRNDKVKVKYQDGRIIENKYKKLEADILAERCVLV